MRGRMIERKSMASAKLNMPSHWEDWCAWLIGIWLLLSPWALRFSYESAATGNAVIVGSLIIAVGLVTLSAFRRWEEWLNIALGAWLLVSSWVLAIANTAAKINFVVLGVLVLAFASRGVIAKAKNTPRA
jgi:hypothetical protein